MDNWDDLKIFLEVARKTTLTHAALTLKKDVATIARRIKRLEDVMGAALFLKTHLGYELTDAGQRLLSHTQKMEVSAKAAMTDTRPVSDALNGTIRLGAPDGSANYLLPQVCAEICDENPDLDIQIVALPRVFNLSKREADMAITVSRPKAGRLSIQKIHDYKLHLAASQSYLRDTMKIASKSDLKDHRIIGYIADLIFDAELDYLSEIGAKRVALASNSVSVQLNVANMGGGICMAHDFALPAHPNLVKILPKDVSLIRSFYLVRHADERKSPRLTKFAATLTQKIRKEINRLEALT